MAQLSGMACCPLAGLRHLSYHLVEYVTAGGDGKGRYDTDGTSYKVEHLSVTWFWSAGKCGVEIVGGD